MATVQKMYPEYRADGDRSQTLLMTMLMNWQYRAAKSAPTPDIYLFFAVVDFYFFFGYLQCRDGSRTDKRG